VGISTGDVCVGLMWSGKLSRQMLPQGKPYTPKQEREDKFRFISFLKSPACKKLNETLSRPFDPDGMMEFKP